MDEGERAPLEALKTSFFNEYFAHFLGSGERGSELYIEPSLEAGQGERRVALQSEILASLRDWREDDDGVTIFLVLGESGAGKTSLALSLVKELWGEPEDDLNRPHRIIPVYISLGGLGTAEHVLTNHLARFNHACPAPQGPPYEFVIVLDSYDELLLSNEVNMKQLGEDLNKRSAAVQDDIRVRKVVLLSRAEAIPTNRFRRDQLWKAFEGREGDGGSDHSFCTVDAVVEYNLSPFTREQIQAYIHNFYTFIERSSVEELNGTQWAPIKAIQMETGNLGGGATDVFEWLTKFPDLLRLAGNPFILSLIMLSLPALLNPSMVFEGEGVYGYSQAQAISVTKVGVFDSFTEAWFKYQAERLVKTNADFREMVGVVALQGYLRTYAQNLAQSFLNADGLITAGFVRFGRAALQNEYRLAEPSWHNVSLRNLYHGDHAGVFPTTPRPVPDSEDAAVAHQWLNLAALRNGCLILVRDDTFRFFHRSLVEYFAAREYFEGFGSTLDFYLRAEVVAASPSSSYALHEGIQRERIRDPDVLLQLAERARADPHFQALLFTAVDRSADVRPLARMSSNAITILNAGRVSLSGRNFRNVQIPGANLEHSLCGASDFRGADLSNARLNYAWLVETNFEGANLDGAYFGESMQLIVGGGDQTASLPSVFRVQFVSSSRVDRPSIWIAGFWNDLRAKSAKGFSVGWWSATPNSAMSKMIGRVTHQDSPATAAAGQRQTAAYFEVVNAAQRPENDTIVTVLQEIRIWSIHQRRLLQVLNTPAEFAFNFFAIDSSAMEWLCLGRGRCLRVWALVPVPSKHRVAIGALLASWENDVNYREPEAAPDDIRRLHYDPTSSHFVVYVRHALLLLHLQRDDNGSSVGDAEFREDAIFDVDRFAIATAFGHSRKYFAFGDFTTLKICVYDDEHHEFEFLEKIEGAHWNEIHALAFSSACTYLASGGMDSRVHVWGTATWEQLITLDGFTTNVMSLQFQSGLEERLAVAAEDVGVIKLVNLLTFPAISQKRAEAGAVKAEAEQEEWSALAHVAASTRFKYWYMKEVCAAGGHLALIYASRGVHDPRTVQIVSVATLETISSFDIPLGPIYLFFAFFPNSTLLSIGYEWKNGEQTEFLTLYNCASACAGAKLLHSAIAQVFPSITDLRQYVFTIAIDAGAEGQETTKLAFMSREGHGEVWKIVWSCSNGDEGPIPAFSRLGQFCRGRGELACFKFREKSDHLAATTTGGILRIWSLGLRSRYGDREFACVFEMIDTDFVRDLAFFRTEHGDSGSCFGLIARSLDGELRVWLDPLAKPHLIVPIVFDKRRDPDDILKVKLCATSTLSWIVTTGESGLSVEGGMAKACPTAGVDSLYIWTMEGLKQRTVIRPELEVPLWFDVSIIHVLEGQGEAVGEGGGLATVDIILVSRGYEGGAEVVCIQITRTSATCKAESQPRLHRKGRQSALSYSWRLRWSLPTATTALSAFNARLEHYYGLEELGAILGPHGCALPARKAPDTDDYACKAQLFQPLVATGKVDSQTALIVQFGKSKELLQVTKERWVVSAVAEKKGTRVPLKFIQAGHVYLLLEGVHFGRRFILKAHLTFPDGAFVIIKVYPLDASRLTQLETLPERSEGQQWVVNATQGRQLVDNILEDKARFLDYTFLRKNCAEWAKNHLKRIGCHLRKRWYDPILTNPADLTR